MKPFPRLEMYKGLLQGNLERCIRWTKVARLNEAQPHQFELNDTISTVQVHSTHTHSQCTFASELQNTRVGAVKCPKKYVVSRAKSNHAEVHSHNTK